MKKKTNQIVNNKKGFSLIEVMVVVVIVSILATIAIPQIMRMMPNYRLKGVAKNIFSNLQSAKLEAIQENSRVVMAFTTGAYTADGGVGSYEVFIDNGDGGGTSENSIRDGSETLLSSAAMPNRISLITAGYTFAGGNPTGFNGQGLPIRMGSLQVRTQTRWYRITVSSAGYIRMEISSDGINWSL